MTISKNVEKALNSQLNSELYSAYLYLSIAADMEAKSYTGMAHWFKLQAKEEVEHAMKFYNFILDRGGKVELLSIEKPKTEWQNPLEAFQDAYEHEKKVTSLIYKLVELAQNEKDYATLEMLQWFVKEQVEEEAQTQLIVEHLKMVGDSKNGILMIDHSLSKRGEE
jgi:ferritin